MEIKTQNYRSQPKVNIDDDMTRITVDINRIKARSLVLFLEEYAKNIDNQNFLEFLDEYSFQLHHLIEKSPTNKNLINMLKEQKTVAEACPEAHEEVTNRPWRFV
jgi:hypothetical protein